MEICRRSTYPHAPAASAAHEWKHILAAFGVFRFGVIAREKNQFFSCATGLCAMPALVIRDANLLCAVSPRAQQVMRAETIYLMPKLVV
jgi:hypothetical protein